MKTFKSFADLKKQIESDIAQKINDTLENEVAEAAKAVIQTNIQETVYDAGYPSWYQRRYYKGGLIDGDNLAANVRDGELTISNTTKARYPSWERKLHANGTTLSDLIIDGYGDQDQWYNQPRPYMENAEDDLEDNEKIQAAIDAGLARQGIRRVE